MTGNPRVTVIVPNYNHAVYLKERIESVLSQTWKDFELILLDDASTDSSLSVMNEYASLENVRLIANETNTGRPCAQWNFGVREARGEYVWIAESDDTARPEFLETLVDGLDQQPTAALAQAGSLKIDDRGEVIGPLVNDAFPSEDRWSQSFLADGPEEIQNFLYLQNTIPSASAVVFRKSIYLKAGPADTSFRLAGDWMQWGRMLQHGSLFFVPEPLSFSRIHRETQRSAGAANGLLELETLGVQQQLRTLQQIDSEMARRAADRTMTSWLQAVRSGRYDGPLGRHLSILRKLFQANLRMGLLGMVRLPFCLAIWIVKRILRP